jgi:hypothetical protein
MSDRAFTRRLALLLLAMLACHGNAKSPVDGGDMTCGPDLSTPALCCPAGISGGDPCSGPSESCWTKCAATATDAAEGFHQQYTCSGGQWSAGHGVFPCSLAR